MEEKERKTSSIRRDIEQSKGIASRFKRHDQASIARGQEPWLRYSRNALDYVESLKKFFPDVEQLPRRLKERKERGEHVLVVDLLGEANAKSIGADKTIGFTLTKLPERDAPQLDVVEGDLLSKVDVKKFIAHVDAENTPIACVFSQPYAGLISYRDSQYVLAKYYDVVKELYARLAEDGEMYIQVPTTREASTVTTLLAELFAPSDFEMFGGHPTVDIHVTKRASSPPALPPWQELVDR